MDLLEYLPEITEDKRKAHDCTLSCDSDSLRNYAYGIAGESVL